MEGIAKKDMIRDLRERILAMEGFRRSAADRTVPVVSLGPMDAAFPGGSFTMGAVHEFVSPTAVCVTAANAFISGILSTLMERESPCLWVSTGRSLFPPALKFFAIDPQHVIFVDVKQDAEALWVMEQGLRCKALAAVVAELGEVSFAQSQRLQLAVEQSHITGFLHRHRPRRSNTLACVSRFRVRPVPSHTPGELPGVGYPAFEVRLEKIRNGRPGKWQFEWRGDMFRHLPAQQPATSIIYQSEQYA